MSIPFILAIVALVCFLLAAFNVVTPVNLSALGLAVLVIAWMVSVKA